MGRGPGRGRGPGTWPEPAVRRETIVPDRAAPGAPAVGPDRGGRLVVVVDRERCVDCGACVDVCPDRALSLDARLEVDEGRCTGCGTCLPACPSEALTLRERAPEPGGAEG